MHLAPTAPRDGARIHNWTGQRCARRRAVRTMRVLREFDDGEETTPRRRKGSILDLRVPTFESDFQVNNTEMKGEEGDNDFDSSLSTFRMGARD